MSRTWSKGGLAGAHWPTNGRDPLGMARRCQRGGAGMRARRKPAGRRTHQRPRLSQRRALRLGLIPTLSKADSLGIPKSPAT
jgi:hypothetical protein